MKHLAIAYLPLLAACGSGSTSSDACSGQPGTCVSVDLRDGAAGVGTVDSLLIAVSGADLRHGSVPLKTSSRLPVAVAVLLPDAGGTFAIRVGAVRENTIVGFGQIATGPVTAGQHSSAVVTLAQANATALMLPVSGDQQAAVAGQVLPQTLAVALVDAKGNPVPGLSIGWATAAGAGSVASPSSTTGADGQASVSAAVGSAGDNTFSATAAGSSVAGSPVTFTSHVGKASISVVVESSLAGNGFFGGEVDFAALVTVVAPGSGKPGGAVAFHDGNDLIPGCEQVVLPAPCAVTTLSTGSHQITAVYLGDGDFASSSSVAITQGISRAQTTVAVAANPNPVPAGTSVPLTATINPAGVGGAVSGTVVFFLDGAPAPFPPITVQSNSATLVMPPMFGTFNVSAHYDGDVNFSPSDSNVLPVTWQ